MSLLECECPCGIELSPMSRGVFVDLTFTLKRAMFVQMCQWGAALLNICCWRALVVTGYVA